MSKAAAVFGCKIDNSEDNVKGGGLENEGGALEEEVDAEGDDDEAFGHSVDTSRHWPATIQSDSRDRIKVFEDFGYEATVVLIHRQQTSSAWANREDDLPNSV